MNANKNLKIPKRGSIMYVRSNLNKSGIVTIHEINNNKPRYSHAHSYSADMVYLKNVKPHVSRRAGRILNRSSRKFPCASIIVSITTKPRDSNWKPVFYNPKEDPFNFIMSDGIYWKGGKFAKIQGRKMWVIN